MCTQHLLVSQNSGKVRYLRGRNLLLAWHSFYATNSLLAWAYKSLTIYLTNWAERDIAGGKSQNYPTAAWGGPISLILSAQNQRWMKAHKMPGSQSNAMEMTEAILTCIPHYIDCTWMFNCHLLFSLAESRQEQDTAMESVTGPAYLTGKILFSCHTAPRQQKSRSYFRVTQSTHLWHQTYPMFSG